MRLINKSMAAMALIGLGFLLAKVATNDQISDLLGTVWPLFVGFSIVAIFLFGALFFGAGWWVRNMTRRHLGVDGEMDSEKMVSALVDQFLFKDVDMQTATSAEMQRAAVTNIGVWIFRRQITQFYLGVVLALGGGVIGTSTVFLLVEQNNKLDLQNSKLILQTDASVSQ